VSQVVQIEVFSLLQRFLRRSPPDIMPLSDFVSLPTSFANRQAISSIAARSMDNSLMQTLKEGGRHSQHPDFGHLTLLVFEAVMEVVCVSLPGYIVARQGMFDAESQKFLANLNVMLFTPCLIFTKLASQLTAEKLADLAIIPVIFLVQTLISYGCAWAVSNCMRLKKRQKNFVIAMGVFGNSNSLPISLVISLSQTLKGLHWDKVPNDNDDEVGARGILYLLIFQQLGQLLRWSWGYNVLLAPAEKYSEEDGGTATPARLERGAGAYRDDPEDDEQRRLMSAAYDGAHGSDSDDHTRIGESAKHKSGTFRPSGNSMASSRSSSRAPDLMPTPANGNVMPRARWQPETSKMDSMDKKYDEDVGGVKGEINRFKNLCRSALFKVRYFISDKSSAAFSTLPQGIQSLLTKVWNVVSHFFGGLWEFMNPPLWSMLIAIVVASVPSLQHLFFDDGTFIRNSVTRAIGQSGGVAVPLILVVLGGNLARNTLPSKKDTPGEIIDNGDEKKLLIISLLCRMLLPTLIMAPLLALMAKYIPVSIVDDKIFIIVCFLLTGAPTALQLAQICQVNNVYMGVMSKILFQSYVVWILPSTLILVMMALEVVEWASLEA
jgi:predicted permease